jgi:hypothetical protein
MRYIYSGILATIFAMLLTACSSGLFSSVDTKKGSGSSATQTNDSTASEEESDEAEESSPECIAKADSEDSIEEDDTEVEPEVMKTKGKKASLHDGEEHESDECHSEAEVEDEVEDEIED